MLTEDVAHFLGCCLFVAPGEELDACALSADGYAGPSGVVGALDERGGLPGEAAGVDTGRKQRGIPSNFEG